MFCIRNERSEAHKNNHLPRKSRNLPQWDDSRVRVSDEAVVIKHSWQALRRLMWDYVGIVRTNRRLKRAATHLRILEQEVDDYYASFTITKELLELRNLTLFQASWSHVQESERNR